MAPMIESDSEFAESFAPIARDWYPLEVTACETTTSQKTAAPMAQLDFVVCDGPMKSRKIRFHNIMLGGKTEKGDPMPLGRLCEFINSFDLNWICVGCGTGGRPSEGHSFVKEKLPNGSEGTKLICSSCLKPARFKYNTDEFVGARGNALVDKEKKRDSEDEINVIKRFAPLGA